MHALFLSLLRGMRPEQDSVSVHKLEYDFLFKAVKPTLGFCCDKHCFSSQKYSIMGMIYLYSF